MFLKYEMSATILYYWDLLYYSITQNYLPMSYILHTAIIGWHVLFSPISNNLSGPMLCLDKLLDCNNLGFTFSIAMYVPKYLCVCSMKWGVLEPVLVLIRPAWFIYKYEQKSGAQIRSIASNCHARSWLYLTMTLARRVCI